MNVRVLLAGVVALAISIYAVVKLTGNSAAAIATNPNKVDTPVYSPLPIAKSGPQPKVSAPEVEYEFGRMEVGETRSHDFLFKNVGEAPLIIKMGETTCQCTYGDLKKGEERTIQPGESQTVKLTWKPEFANDTFSKGADILTNDPDPKKQKIILRVAGRVATKVWVAPGSEWFCPDVIDDQPSTAEGGIASGLLDTFQVTSVEVRGQPVECEIQPMEAEYLAKANHASCGYHVRIKIMPDMQLGPFKIPVTIKTDVPVSGEGADAGKTHEFEVLVSGVHRGPIRFAGPDWIEERMAITLRSFEVATGKQIDVPVFVRNPPPGGFQLTEPPEVIPPELKVELLPAEKLEGKSQRFTLRLSYPPNAPRAEFRAENPGRIKFKTNHPKAADVEILVYVNSH